MAGMVGYGQGARNSALQAMQRYSSLDAKLKAEQESMNKMEAAQQQQMNMSYGGVGGAAAGAMIGGAATSWSGPGMVVGAAIGGLVGALGGSLF